MKQETIEQLNTQLKQLGFTQPMLWLDKVLNDSFILIQDGYPATLTIPITKKAFDNYQIDVYKVTVKEMDIPEQYKELDKKLYEVNKIYDAYYSGEQKPGDTAFVEAVDGELKKLLETDRPAAELLMFKYLPEDEYKKYITDVAALREKHEVTYHVPASISSEAVLLMHRNLNDNKNWIAYNPEATVLQKTDLYFGESKAEVTQFAYDIALNEKAVKISFAANPQVAIQIISTKNLSIMNEKNFDYLKDNLKYMGFGEKQHKALEANLKEGKESFQLNFNADVNKKPFEAILNFRRSETSDMYFLNSYKASLEWSNGEKKEQTFYLNYGKGVTAKEAFNLLSGRSVEKELIRKLNKEETVQFKAELKLPPEQKGLPENWEKAPTYKAWIQLDFENKDKHNNFEVKQFHEKFGYDLKEAVGKYAVIELDGGDKEKALLQSLQKGNIQSVTIEKAGTEVKMFIEANPQYKTVTLYDEGFKRVQKEDLAQYQSTKQLNGKEVKQSAGQEQKEVKEDQKQGKQVGKKNKDEKDDSLLPKKRNRQKKGLGLK